MSTAFKFDTRSLQQLCLSLRNLIGVNVKLLRQLRDRLGALDSRQRNFRFEYRSMILAWPSWHDCLLISLPITWLISGFESTYTTVRFLGATPGVRVSEDDPIRKGEQAIVFGYHAHSVAVDLLDV